MFWYDFALGLIFLSAISALAWFLASYMNWAFHPDTAYARMEEKAMRFLKIRVNDQHWRDYLYALLMLHVIGGLFLFLLLLFQDYLPANPRHFPGLPWHIALHTAASFITNTNLQSYSGEASLSYLCQSLGIGVQQFLSAASGMAVCIAVIRAFQQESMQTIGNFWRDIVRITLLILLPISIVFSLFLIQQGMPQNFNDYVMVQPFTGEASYLLPQGPVASQVAIKMIGSNGGGFFGANAGHPFENPTWMTNWAQLGLILLLPIALIFLLGKMLRQPKQGVSLYAAATILFVINFAVLLHAQWDSPPWMNGLVGSKAPSNSAVYEGQQYNSGVLGSALWSAATTATSNGSSNTAIASQNPLAISVMLLQMHMGEIMYGGVGAGLYTLILFAILSVFIAALMIGRSPEYLSKKIEVFEIKTAVLTLISIPFVIFLSLSFALLYPDTRDLILNPGAAGYTEVLYAFSSAAANNGSSMGGFDMTHWPITVALSLVMIWGRFVPIVGVLAIAGALARKKKLLPSVGTLATDTGTFVFLLCGTIVLLGALTYFPALSLGSVLDYLMLMGYGNVG